MLGCSLLPLINSYPFILKVSCSKKCCRQYLLQPVNVKARKYPTASSPPSQQQGRERGCSAPSVRPLLTAVQPGREPQQALPSKWHSERADQTTHRKAQSQLRSESSTDHPAQSYASLASPLRTGRYTLCGASSGVPRPLTIYSQAVMGKRQLHTLEPQCV